MHANVISEREQHIAVRRGGDINAVSNRPEHNTHTKHYGHKPARQRSQQHKTNMENNRSLKRTLLQAETQKNSEKQPFTIVIPRKSGKELPEVLPSANMGNRISNIHESTRRFNAASRKNTKEQSL